MDSVPASDVNHQPGMERRAGVRFLQIQDVYHPYRAGTDWLSVQVAVKVLGQLLGAGIAAAGSLVQTLEADGFQVSRHLGVQPRRRGRLLGDDLPFRFCRTFGLKWRPTGEHLVENRPQRINIDRRADRPGPAECLFRGHVAGGADRSTADGELRATLDAASQAEVRDLRCTVGREKDVRRFQIAVNDPAGVGELHGPGQDSDQLRRLACRLGLARQFPRETSTFDKFHREVRSALVHPAVEDLHDVRVPQARHRLRLPLEPAPLARLGIRAGERHLQRDQPVELQMPDAKDDPHTAAAEHRLDLVTRDARQGQLLRCRFALWREESVQIGPDATHLPPAVADDGQQLGTRVADLFRRGV
jgi:hypothetical protein